MSRQAAPQALAAGATGFDPALVAFLREARLTTLGNGLTVCVAASPRVPIVSTALWYRVGTRHEAPRYGGVAHFLEHMMFKGASRYGPGEIDRATQVLGGSNNAFTGHDATAYYFSFAADRWQEALQIEADRMAGLRLEPDEVTSERQVIVEEIAMYEDDPWDALELAAHARWFGSHPYARPVLGTPETLARIDAEVLRRFHARWYRPGNAVLVLAGDLGPDAEDVVERHLGHLAPGLEPPPPLPPLALPRSLARLERRQGELPRLMLVLAGPPTDSPEHAALKLAIATLAHGRSSRLQRRLVDEGELCSWANADLTESPGASIAVLEAELLPDVEPERVEAEMLAVLAELGPQPFTVDEVERARRGLLADWVFGHESVHQQALTLGSALALFDLEQPERQLTVLSEVAPDEVAAIAAATLRPENGGLLAWSLPA